jgi:succinyl-CoA synthetase beta subunit
MDLLEYQGKQLFARHGVPVPDGRHATSVEEAVAAGDEVGFPCVVKAQVQIGGRGKAGGIRVARDRSELREHAEAILGMDIRGLTVHELWIEGASEIEYEYYASVVFDRSAKAPLLMLSTKGGMDIEEVASEDPSAIARLHVDPLLGYQDFHGRRLAYEAGVDGDVVRAVGAMLAKLYDVFVSEEATLVEVNPLIVTPSSANGGGREVKALDAKVTLDDNSSGIRTTRSFATSQRRIPRSGWPRSAVSSSSSSTATSASSATAPDWSCRHSTSSPRPEDRRRTSSTPAAAPRPRRSPTPSR